MRALLTTLSVSALLASGAFAQAPEQTSPPQVKNEPAAERIEKAQQPAATQAGPWSADRLMDTKIRSPEGEELGEIEDLLVDDTGKIVSVVVEVGGFLGIGEKDVLLPFNELELTGDGDGNVLLKSNADKAKLETAPEYKTSD
ncbi:PRC-barrel domain-containing protein [Hyphomicrobium sp. CS1GBMeth3]|uniref:PRC-barrel domain-containing protein n=1 Tax=Hyphomicrobium sp. CS1GBMeth3 TaxID=1892845 RepID=UPI0009312316|nr:PRC-barrel domain-containing protein [Hyphomicrobium sp. CS1GBMeth3]